MSKEVTHPKPATVLFAAGGTGGHIFPAVAVAEALVENQIDVDIRFTGTPERMESRIIPALGFEFDAIPFRGWRGLSVESLRFPFALASSVRKAMNILKQHNVALVVGTGSYITLPACLAAALRGIPIVLLEANLNPGKANSMLARFAHTICTSFEKTRDLFSTNAEILYTGNPVRRSLRKLPTRSGAKQRLQLHSDAPVVFVFGGSLGAASINEAIEQSLHEIETNNIQLIWQTGKGHLPQHAEDLRNSGHIVEEFYDDMALPLAAADLVVSRSGGTTVAELTALGIPAILVPMPHAANNEQLLMAQELDRVGAAALISDSELKQRLWSEMQRILNTPEVLSEMQTASKQIGKLEAADSVAEIIQDIVSQQ